MTGVLILDKPAGITSFGAARRARGVLGAKKAGHTGTLDPMATGVLPILLGGATRFCALLPSQDKKYRATLRFGLTTTTLDITGTVTGQSALRATRAALLSCLNAYRGDIEQLPPMYSAVSQNGVRLYELARRGLEVERPRRRVTVYALELLSFEEEKQEAVLEVHCSAGTYVRTLADDMGRDLGCGAVLAALRRTLANGFEEARCVTLERLKACGPAALLPLEQALGYPALVVSEAQARRFANGGALDAARLCLPPEQAELFCVRGPSGVFLGVGRLPPKGEALLAEKVVSQEARLPSLSGECGPAL
jgi:tRNA pseudouridine55 synthase